MTTIAFIGLGAMGAGMAANQAKAGHKVLAYDLSPTALERARAQGCTPAGSAAEAVKAADVVITMLPAGQHVRAVYHDEILPNARLGTLLIDCSTIDVDSARAVAKEAQAHDLAFADAPVSGGTAAADSGALTFMVGCHEASFAQFEAALAPMAKAVIHAGEAGAGQAAKICNNMILGISMIGVAEAFVLAEKLGLSHQALFDVASTSSGQCWSLTTYCPVPGPVPTSPANNDYKPGFAAGLMLKDLGLAQEASQTSGATTPLGEHARAIFERFAQGGNEGVDFSGIVRYLREGRD